MSDLPWVRFFPSDWLAGTSGLTALEIGVYITAIATMYERGLPIPESDSLRRRCGCTTTQFTKAISSLVGQGKLIRMDGGLWNRRVDQEHGLRIKRAVQGKEAVTKRWEKVQQNQSMRDTGVLRENYGSNTSQISKKDSTLTTSETLLRPRDAEGSPALEALPPRRALTEAERSDRLKAALERMAATRGKAANPPGEEPSQTSVPEANRDVA